MTAPDEIRSLAERVKELRQELESVEARLRELSGDRLEPIEPIDAPTVLTTNHAQRRARAEQRTPWLAAFAAVSVLGVGIAAGYALRAPLPQSPAPVPLVVTLAPPSPPPPVVASAPPVVEPAAPTATASATTPPAAALPPPLPPPSPAIQPQPPTTPAATAQKKPDRTGFDRGF